VAICETEAGLPCCREIVAPVMVGGLLAALTVRVKLAVEVAPQLSVAVTVTVKLPAGPALVIVITPVDALPENVPVKPGADAVRLVTDPLSVGAALGVTVVEPPVATLVAG